MSRVQELNDALRTTFTGGRVVMTSSVSTLPSNVQETAIQMVIAFDDFTHDNDPHGEHDFGSFDLVD